MQTIYQAVSPLGCQQFIEYFRLIALLQIFFLQKFNLSGRICQGLAKLQSIFRNNIYTNDISCMFFKYFILYLQKVPTIHCIFDQGRRFWKGWAVLPKFNISYQRLFPKGIQQYTANFVLFTFGTGLIYISNFFVQRTSNNHCTIGKENFPPFPITPNIMLIFLLCCQKLWLKSSN